MKFVWAWLIGACALASATAATPLAQARAQAAFTPDCEGLLLEHLATATQEVRAAVFTITRHGVADVLIARAAAGVDVRIKVDAAQVRNVELMAELVAMLRRAKVNVEEISMPPARYGANMHHKFAVIDKRWIITGSANWTKAGTAYNWENVLAIDSPELAAKYLKEWNNIQNGFDAQILPEH